MPQIPELAAFSAAWCNHQACPDDKCCQDALFLAAAAALPPVRQAAVAQAEALRTATGSPEDVLASTGGDDVGAFPWALIMQIIMDIIRKLIDGWT